MSSIIITPVPILIMKSRGGSSGDQDDRLLLLSTLREAWVRNSMNIPARYTQSQGDRTRPSPSR